MKALIGRTVHVGSRLTSFKAKRRDVRLKSEKILTARKVFLESSCPVDTRRLRSRPTATCFDIYARFTTSGFSTAIISPSFLGYCLDAL